jgi:hypothetical protein
MVIILLTVPQWMPILTAEHNILCFTNSRPQTREKPKQQQTNLFNITNRDIRMIANNEQGIRGL